MPESFQQARPIHQVMVSSTFIDLKGHRKALISALHAHKLHASAMENDSARLEDVIESSLNMVRDSAAYIGVIGMRYGQTPVSKTRNPKGLSVTELEFDEAQRLGRPILLFIMGDGHSIKTSHIEEDPKKNTLLNAFRERAKRMSPDSDVHRVYAQFNSLGEFKEKIGSSIAELRESLDSKPNPTPFGLTESDPVLREGIDWMHDYVNRALKLLLAETQIPIPKKCGINVTQMSLSMKLSGIDLVVRFGRIQECEDRLPGCAVALPSTEFFDDKCATDTGSALGSYVKQAFQDKLKNFLSVVAERLKHEPSVLVDRIENKMQRSYGVAKCLYFENPLKTERRVILVSATTERANVGLRCEPYYLFAVMKALFQLLKANRLSNLELPAMGSGHGGVEPELALLYLILSLKAVIDRNRAGTVKKVTIVVFQKDKRTPPLIARDVVSRIMSIATVVP